MIEIYTTEDKNFTLLQEDNYVKIFYLKDNNTDEMAGTFIPALEGEHFSPQEGNLPMLTGRIDEDTFLEKTGLPYVPEFFKDVRFLDKSYLRNFGLEKKEHMLSELGSLLDGDKGDVFTEDSPTIEPTVEPTNSVVEPLSREGEELRETCRSFRNDKGDESIYDLVHESISYGYALGSVEKELEILMQKHNKKVAQLEDKRRTAIEKLDTFKFCIKKLLREENND